MTQVASDFERKDFTSVPNIIYDGYAELKPLDRHVAATLLRRCYMAGWHALSMRDIEDLSGVPHNLMRSIQGREGILNRLQRATENIFNFKDGATVNRKGKKGRPQTYISVDIVRLWKANTAFYIANKGLTMFDEPKTEDAITVSEGYSHPSKGRRKTVSEGYDTVSTGCNDVSEGYDTVSDASVNVDTKITKIENTKIFTPAHESDPVAEEQPLPEEKKSDESLSTGTPATLSYSQGPSETTETEYENETCSHRIGLMSNLIAELETTLTPFETQLFASSERSWLQENAPVTIDTPSQVPVVITQVAPPIAEPATSLFPPEPKPASKYDIPSNLSMKPDVPTFNTKSGNVAKERSEIEKRIWKLLDDEAGAKIGRVFTNPMASLVTSYMDGDYVDEDFVIAVQLVRKQKIKMSFTNIVNSMADAVIERKKIITFPGNTNKPKSIDEKLAASERAAKEFEADQKAKREARLAREAKERMAVAQ